MHRRFQNEIVCAFCAYSVISVVAFLNLLFYIEVHRTHPRTGEMIMKTFPALLVLCFALLAVPSHAQLHQGSFTFDGETREYMVYLPGSYDGSSDAPLVISLHCYAWTAQQWMDYSQLHLAADASGYIVAYPSAIPDWNSGIGENPYFPTPQHDDVGFIEALIDTLRQHYSIDNSRVFACGFSNGGFMSYRLACDLSHRIAAIASVAGVLPNSIAAGCNPIRTVPVLHIHGSGDFVVPVDGNAHWPSVSQTLDHWISRNNCTQADSTAIANSDPNDGCTVMRFSYTNCEQSSDIEYYRVDGGGHTWPGAGPGGVPLGNTTHDIDANAVILSFFDGITNPLADMAEDMGAVMPTQCSLQQNYPNPFNPTTTISYELPRSMEVRLIVTDALGREVWTAGGRKLEAGGKYSVVFDASGMPSGVYFYRLVTEDAVLVKKMVLMK